MATHRITAPDGSVYDVTAPEGASDAQVLSYVQAQHPVAAALAPTKAPVAAAPPADYGLSDLIGSKMTMGILDKVAAGGQALGQSIGAVARGATPHPLDAYHDAITQRDTAKADYQAKHPVLDWGTLPLNLYAPGKAIGATIDAIRAAPTAVKGLAAFAQGAKASVVPGIVAGVGNSRGDYADQAGQVAATTGLAALAGGAASRFIPGAIAAATNIARPAVRKVAQVVAPRSALATDAGSETLQNLPPTAAAAQNFIAGRLAADGTDPAALAAQMQAARARGVPYSPMDSGPNMQRAAAAIVRKSGPGSKIVTDAVTGRQFNQGERIQGAMARDLGPTASVRQASEDLMTQAKAAAKPHYDAAYAANTGISNEPGTDLNKLLATPAGRSALGRAHNIAANEMRDPMKMGFGLDAEGNTTLTKVPSPQTLDYVKRGLDDLVEAHRDPVTGRLNLDEAGRAINGVRANLVKILRDGNPAYAKALDAYAGPARMASALAKGSKVAGKSADDITAYMRDVTPAEIEQFRLGARSALSRSVGDKVDAADRVRALIGTDNKRKALTQVFGGADGLDNFMATLGHEAQTSATYQRVTGNSKTAENTLDDADLSGVGKAVGSAVHLAHGNPLPALAHVWTHLSDKLSGEAGQSLRHQVASLITQSSPEIVGDFLAAAAKQHASRVVSGKAVPVIGATAARTSANGLGLLTK